MKDANNDWVHEVISIKAMVRNFFIDLYCDNHQLASFPIQGCFPTVDSVDWDFVYLPLSLDEIKDTLFYMGGLKAPGLDSLHALFYQSQWDVVGNSICKLVGRIFEDPTAISSINQTFISLIPKIEKLEHVKHFRPIGLCNVSYKLTG